MDKKKGNELDTGFMGFMVKTVWASRSQRFMIGFGFYFGGSGLGV